jgi:hypothetical protein
MPLDSMPLGGTDLTAESPLREKNQTYPAGRFKMVLNGGFCTPHLRPVGVALRAGYGGYQGVSKANIYPISYIPPEYVCTPRENFLMGGRFSQTLEWMHTICSYFGKPRFMLFFCFFFSRGFGDTGLGRRYTEDGAHILNAAVTFPNAPRSGLLGTARPFSWIPVVFSRFRFAVYSTVYSTLLLFPNSREFFKGV